MNIAGKWRGKLFCIVLAVVFFMVQAVNIAPAAAFAENSYEYSPNRQKYAIAPGALYGNQDFYNSYVKTDAVWAFNSITYFTGNTLNYSTEKVGYNASFLRSLQDFDPILENLRKKGDLLVNFRVCLANNGNFKQSAELKYIKKYMGYQSSSEYCVYGDMDFIKYIWGSIQMDYKSSADDQGSRMKNSSLVFADATSPKMQEIYASSTIDGPATNLFNKNSSVAYIHVKFDENIRFSDNNRINDTTPASHNNIYLKLSVESIGGTTITNAGQRAKLVRFKGDTLTFKYDIPDTINNEVLNHCITGIDGIVDYDKGGKGGANVLNDSYPLRVLTYTGELYGHYTSTGLDIYTSRSLITDAAGNPADTALISPKNPIYLDKVSPYVEKVSFGAPESKSQYVGLGYKITPSVTFNESLYYSYNDTTRYIPISSLEKFMVTLNIKDQSGNYLTASGSSFSSDSKVLTFNTLTLPTDMTVHGTDPKIEITSINFSDMDYNFLRPRDARGNMLDKQINLLPVPADQFRPDAVKPAIATDFNMTDGKYIPVTYDSDGDAKKDSFYFSFGLSDTGSGVQPFGGGANLKGSFRWDLNGPNNTAADTENLSYKFNFVYDSTESPGEDSQWYEGKFGQDYTFTQIGRAAGSADNIYLHIKVDGLEGVDLDESTLSVTAIDLVKNRDTKEFILDGIELSVILDRTPPDINVNKLYTYKDVSDGDKWKFAADFTLTDKSLVNTNKVYSQWVEKDAAPSEGDWTQVAGLGSDAKRISATIEYTLVNDAMNAMDLYIKAVDCSNKENANDPPGGPYAFARDLRKPVCETTASVDMTTRAALVIEAAAQINNNLGSEPVPAVILVTVGSSYKAFDLSTPMNVNVFDSSLDWLNISDNNSSNDSTLSSVINGTYYGDFKAKVDIGYGISYSGGIIQDPYDSLGAEESYTFYTAPSSERIHDIAMTSSLADTASGWSSPADGPKYYTTMAGVTFNVAVENARMPGWGSRDADFENSFFALYRAADNTSVFTAPIGMVSTITIPEGLYLTDGSYYAKATVTAKTSGRVDESNIFYFRIDRTQPEDFGLSMTETLWQPTGEAETDALFGKIGADTVLYGYDRVYNSGVENYDSISTIFLGSGNNGLAAAARKLYFTIKSTNDEFYIKVWNATEGVDEAQSKAAAVWRHIGDTADSTAGPGFTAFIVDSAAEVITSYSAGVIPVISNTGINKTENIIKYQICHANGIESVEKVLLAEVSNDEPQLEVALTPESLPSKEVTAKVTRLYSPSTPDMKAFFWAGGSAVEPKTADEAADADGNIPLLQEDNNWFYASNIYGNYTILNKQAANLDAAAPVLTSTAFSQDGDMYQFSVTIKDKNPWDLFMKFDDAYMTRLGHSGYFRLEVPEPEAYETERTWTAGSPRPDGIYKIVRTDSPDGTVNLVVTGVYLYDDGGGSPPTTKDVAYSLLARDAVGNESTFDMEASPVKNARLELSLGETTVTESVPYYNSNNTPPNEDRQMNLYSMRASFNLPVKNVTPLQHHNAENSYSLTKDYLSIFKDGVYTVTYQDIFGRNYSKEETVSVRNDNDMTISMTGLDAEDKFTMSVKPVANEVWQFEGEIPTGQGKGFAVFRNIYDASRPSSSRIAYDMQFNRGDTVIIAMTIYRSAWNGWFLNDSIPLILIDGSTRQVPSAEVHWYYHEFGSDTLPAGETETDDDVDVWVTSDTPITGVNSKLLSHTFSYGGAGSYTFEYANSDGLIHNTTVTLPVSIVQNKEHQDGSEYFQDLDLNINEDDLYKKPTDIMPPEVIFSVYGNYGSYLRDKGSWYSGGPESADELKDLFTWASTFVLKADIIDDSKTKIILLENAGADIGSITYGNAQNAAIQGVVLDGKNIRVTGQVMDPAAGSAAYPEAFKVLLIDEADNKKVISFPSDVWGQLDIIAPWLDSLSYTKTDLAKIDATFKLKDDKTPDGQVELLSPLGLSYDSGTGVYTMSFTENKTVQTALRDLAGNVGSGAVQVTNLDDQPPAITAVWWSKGYVDSNGVYDPTQPTVEKTNQTITAKLTFNKPVKGVELTYVKDNGNNYALVPLEDQADYVTWTWDTNSVVVDFLQNAAISFSYTAANGKKNVYGLDVDVIDKSVPAVMTAIDDKATATSATVTFSGFSEPVHIYGPGETGERLYGDDPGDVLTKTFTGRGTYIFRFTDEAGNTHTEKIKIENIDEYPPGILVADLPAAGTYYSDSVNFKATMSEAGTLSFGGVSAAVAAPADINGNGTIDADVNNNGKVDAEDDECDWHTFTATQNGNFPITAVDTAGRKTTAYVAISCFDKAGPVISFNPTTITVMSGTDAASFIDLLEQGVTVTDNSTASGDITLTHGDAAAVNLTIPGKYQVAFTATDRAGNATTANRYVKVFSASEINVAVNGIRTESKGTVVLKDQQVTLEISKLPMGDNEPYKVYLRKGIWTEGLMKGTEPLKQTGSFTLSEKDCFYTLYIVTQNRGTYLTYLYILLFSKN